jgi:hypothetical protein
MLRIDVSVANAHPEGYVVPPGNPFAGSEAVLGEIWAFGLRNPWRWSFDDPARGGTGALVIADVGQNSWEEVNYEPFGAGAKLTGRATTYEYVSSVSDDERTMFMAAEYATRVLVRSGPEEIYSDLSPTIMPSRLPGWRAIPIDGCRRLITTITPGGCESEQTVFFEAVGM